MQSPVYLLCAGLFAIILFLYGFFPLKIGDGLIASEGDFPTSVGDVQLNPANLYQPIIGKLVIMVVDALRSDFVSGIDGPANMPYTSSLISQQKACHVTGRADPPTVTMPRIKAIVSGTVPNYVDVLLNLGSSEMTEDNLILQARKRGWNMVFYGDETWLKLFPDMFLRSEGTTSFFVSDFQQVDDNVTRHLAAELDAGDWRIMVLHYLGLDHIGHAEGPKSSHVQPKLHEMDEIVRRIHNRLVESDKEPGEPSLLLVCGDHGMKDTGSHGGASLAEVLVPVVMIGQICSDTSSSVKAGPDIVSQIDLAATLSVLLGLPIPRSNVGRIIPRLLHTLPTSRQLYALQYNAKQVARQYARNVVHEATGEHMRRYAEAVRLHASWIRSNQSGDAHQQVASLYASAVDGMSSELAESMVRFDLHAMSAAIIILWQICVILLLGTPTQATSTRRRTSIAMAAVLALLISASLITHDSVLCRVSVVSVLTLTIVSINCYHLCAISPRAECSGVGSLPRCLVTSGWVGQVLSLASSSLIEEEHQVWYFLWTSFSLVFLYHLVHSGRTKLAWQWLLIALLHRLLRKWNQTGDKWAAVPDIGDWLRQPENKCHLSVALVLGLAGVFLSCEHINSRCGSSNKSSRFLHRILWGLSVSCIYCYRGATGSVFMPSSYPQSRGVLEVQIFWCLLCLLLLLPVYQLKTQSSLQAPLRILNQVACSVTTCWVLLSALLHRPHNALLLPAQIFVSFSLHAALRRCTGHNRAGWMSVLHLWLGTVFYFYQGNSNSVASVDVTAGYVGQEDFGPIKASLLLMANTYSAHVLAHFLLLLGIIKYLQSTDFQTFVEWLGMFQQTVVFLRVVPLAAYVVLITFQRYHLFVWTVFAPKLLYEAMHTFVTLLLIVTVQFMLKIVVTKTMKQNKN